MKSPEVSGVMAYAHPPSKVLIAFNPDDWWESRLPAAFTDDAERNPGVGVMLRDLYRTLEDEQIRQRCPHIFSRRSLQGVHHALKELVINGYLATHTAVVNRKRIANRYPTSAPVDPSLVYVGDYCLPLQLLWHGVHADGRFASSGKHGGQHASEWNIVTPLEEVAMFRKNVNELISSRWEAIHREAASVRGAILDFKRLTRGSAGEGGEYLLASKGLQASRRLDAWLAEMMIRLPRLAQGQSRRWNSARKMPNRLVL